MTGPNVEIIGGYFSGANGEDDANVKQNKGTFVEKKRVVVREDKVGTYFKHDPIMLQMPVIYLNDTTARVTYYL